MEVIACLKKLSRLEGESWIVVGNGADGKDESRLVGDWDFATGRSNESETAGGQGFGAKQHLIVRILNCPLEVTF
jgi:hypothetical protein